MAKVIGIDLGTTHSAMAVVDETGRPKIIPNSYGRHGITGERADEVMGIHAVRAGDIIGDHIVLYAGKGERLKITHRAHNREAFAQGAIKAIEWVSGKEKKGDIYDG